MRTARRAAGQRAAVPPITAVPMALLQRQCTCGAHAAGGECEDCKKKGVLSRKASGPVGSVNSAAFAAADMSMTPTGLVAETLRSPGQPLDRDTRAFMESRFQRDFSAVRVHTDALAAASAEALQARAWTFGSHVAFAPGAYAPRMPGGRRLLAHELTHVVQHERASAPMPSPSLNVSAPGDASEREAERVATRVADGSPVSVRTNAEPHVIQRDIDYGKLFGGLGAFGAIVGISEYVKRRRRKARIDFRHCDSQQQKKINSTVARGRTWATTALERLRAFKSKPAANQDVRATLLRRFGGADQRFRDRIERVVQQIADGLNPSRIHAICHTATEKECGFAAAWLGPDGLNFCPAFFKRDEPRAIVAVLHELAHFASGAPIRDRAYEGERKLRGVTEPTGLSGAEALTNAESYAETIAELGTGQAYGMRAPADQLDCPEDWKGPLRFALADAERAVVNMASDLSMDAITPDEWRKRWTATGIQGPAPNINEAAKIYNTLQTSLFNPVHIVCKPDPGDSRREGDAEWQDTPPTLSLCLAWKARGGRERTISLLAALSGLLANVAPPEWRAGLAQIAVDTLTSERFGPPPKGEDVFSRAAAARRGREA